MDKNMRILIVDDFSTMRRIIKNLLRDLGFTNTDEADDGNTALPMLRSGKYDFLVTDWNMPGMTGFDLLKAVRADENLKNLPVLRVTAISATWWGLPQTLTLANGSRRWTWTVDQLPEAEHVITLALTGPPLTNCSC